MPKTARTIFHTTEKSNFILNMKSQDYYHYNLKILLSFFILMPIFSFILEFAKVYSVPAMALSITGVFAIVFVLIGFMKSETPKNLFLPAGILGAMLLWGLVSLYNSYFYHVSIFGSDGRNEGWLSILFYGSFFLLGSQLGTDANRLKLLHGMLYMGLAECAWGLLQALPIGIPSYYQNLEPLLLLRLFLPSGLTGSPIFLAILLNMLVIPALLGSIFEIKKARKLFYMICSICFIIFAVKTQCVLGVFGSGLAILSVLIYALVKKAGKQALLRSEIALFAFLIGIGWIYFSPSINHSYRHATGQEVAITNQFALYDGGIIWEDSSYRLAVSGYYIQNGAKNPNGNFDIANIPETYQFILKSTARIIKRFPLAGSGCDSLVYPQIYQNPVIASNPNTFDRCYNYYLHIAGTLGIPMLLLFFILMILVIKNGISACKNSNNWLHVSMFGAVLCYLILMLLGTSSITVAPLFWMLAGVCVNLPKNPR
ncbi:MAG: hypothetical protein K2O52_05710 [Oscillospiraceae bacterium]|nr:hypothetical protein [Oscillospiraceae bacterium]